MLTIAQKLVAVGVLLVINMAFFMISPYVGVVGLFLTGPLSLAFVVSVLKN